MRIAKIIGTALVVALVSGNFAGCAQSPPVSTEAQNAATPVSAASAVAPETASATLAEASAASEDPPARPVTITFWHTRGSGEQYDVLNHQVTTFNDTIGAEKGVTVEEVFIGGYNDIITKTQLAIQSGEQPQLAVIGNGHVGYLIEDGALADMMPYAQAASYDVNNLLQPFLEVLGNTDGHLTSIPYIRSTPLLYYNKTMAQTKALTPSNEIENGMVEFCKGFYEVDSATGEAIVYGLEIPNDFGYLQVANLYQLGSAALSDDGKSSPALADGAMLKVLSDWRQWVDEGWCRSFASGSGAVSTAELFAQGKLGAYVGSSGGLSNTLNNLKDTGIELGVLPYPTYAQQPLAEIGGGNICVIRQGNTEDQVAACWDFVQHVLSDEMVAYNTIQSGYLPVTRSIVSYQPMLDFWSQNPIYQVPYKQLETARCQERPYVPYLQDYVAACWDTVSLLIQDQSITPEEAVEMIRSTTADLF
jgi:sn-glycerol 3-phosphate transport system substrate-binding protein